MAQPWIGKHYDETRLLLLGESTYSWEEEGELRHASEHHCGDMVGWAINDFEGCRSGGPRFIVTLSRALTVEENPNHERLRHVWERVALTNYVAESVGTGARTRPSRAMWDAARETFPALLQQLKPRRVVILGDELWKNMPNTQLYLTDNMQAYRLDDGKFAYCWATYHPSGRLGWRELAAIINFACGPSLSGP